MNMRIHAALISALFAGVSVAGDARPVIIEQQPPVEIPEYKAATKILGKNVAGWIEHLQTHENEKERKLAIMCLTDFGAAAAGAVPELRKLLKDELQPDVGRYAIDALAAIGPAAGSTVSELLAILNDTKMPAGHRASACAAVSQIQPDTPAVRKAILAALRDPNADVRAAAIDGTVLLPPGDKAVLTALSNALSNQSDASAAAFSLLCLGDEGAAVLYTAIERGGSTARIAAAKALSHAGGDTAATLAAILKAAKRERDASVKRELSLREIRRCSN
jgi:HEAT repeat protein